MTYFYSTFALPLATPLDFSVAVDADGAVVATAFGSRAALERRLFSTSLVKDETATSGVRDQLSEYAAGGRREFTIPLAAQGSAFQQRVWTALLQIPFGETRSYGQLAVALKSAPRAVGRANATNPICLIVPCHRVIGADGSLTGFAFGEEVKRALLQHEQAPAERFMWSERPRRPAPSRNEIARI